MTMEPLFRIFMAWGIVLGAWTPAWAAPPPSGVVTVQAEGQGATERDAERRALQNAVEQAVGVQVHSSTRVEEGAVVSDRIRTHAEAYVQSIKPLSKRRAPDGTFVVQLEVSVNTGQVLDNLEVLRQLTDRLGKVNFMVIDDHRSADDRGDAEATVAAVGAVHRFLTARLLDVVDQAEVERLKREDAEVAGAAETEAQRIAKRLNAHVYVTVFGHVERTASVNVRFFEAATGRILGEDTGYSPAAEQYLANQKLAVEKAVEAAASKAFETTIGYWRRDTAQGQQVTVVAYGLNFKRRSVFRKVLQRVVGGDGEVKQISASGNYAEFTVWIKMPVTDFLESVAEKAEKAGLKLAASGDGPNQRFNRLVFKFEKR